MHVHVISEKAQTLAFIQLCKLTNMNVVLTLLSESTKVDRQMLGVGKKEQKSLLPFGMALKFTFWHIQNSFVSYPSPRLSPELHQSNTRAKNNKAQPGASNDFCMLHPHISVSV